MSNETIRPITTSHSIDNLFDYCARKFEFLTLYDKRPERESGFAAEVGTSLHDATQAWLVARSEGHSDIDCRTIGFLTLLKRYPHELYELESSGIRSLDITFVMFQEIIEHESWDDWELVKVGDKWAVEVPFLIRHESMGVFPLAHTGQNAMLATQGKIDFILRNRHTGVYRTRDLKTTTIKPELEEAEWKFSGQQIGYSNVLWAMLEVPPENLEVDYLVAHFNGTDYPTVSELTIELDQDRVDDYWLTKIERLRRMKEYAMNGRWARTNGGCHTWHHPCFFLKICETRDYDLIDAWFEGIATEEQKGYDYWVTLGV